MTPYAARLEAAGRRRGTGRVGRGRAVVIAMPSGRAPRYRAAGVDPYYVGKPNQLMMRSALNAIEAHSETTAMIGDRMDTDVVSGLEAGLHAILVLTGVATRAAAERFPYRPSRIVESVADLVDEVR